MPHSSDPARRDASRPARLQVAVVSHTHWDREWYHQAERFRQRLVAVVDAVLDQPDRVGFLLDGQTIVLDDYLRVRPEAHARLTEALQRGTVEAGPWFVLADNLIPSGEALVRNLEAGRRMMRRFGAAAPAVLYCPDTFGHPAAMPVLADGFGLPVAIVWRGVGGLGHPRQDAFIWNAASGEQVVVYHLPPDGYEIGSALPLDEAPARARWVQLAPMLRQRAATKVSLLLNGADHHARQPQLAQRIARLADVAASEADVIHCSLGTWATQFACAAEQVALPHLIGELRNSYGYTWTLGGTLATRAHQKRVNAMLERALLRDVEPWLALLRLREPEAPVPDAAARVTMAQLPVLLHRAWEDVLSTHPHDTLCGCSIDAVARAMTQRQEQVHAQIVGLRDAAWHGLLRHDPIAARERAVSRGMAPVVVRNRAARPRSGVARISVMDTLADVGVGPGSAVNAGGLTAAGDIAPLIAPRWVTQTLRETTHHHRRESPQHYPDNDLVRTRQLLVWVPPVASFGARVLALQAVPEPDDVPHPVEVHDDGTEIRCANEHCELIVRHADTAPSVSLRVADRTIDDIAWLETQHDAGDTYTPAPRGVAERLRAVKAWVTHRGPLRATIRIAWRTASGTRSIGPHGVVRVITDFELDAASRVLRCRVHGSNRRTAHRLQFVWRTDIAGGATVTADAAFGPVVRHPMTAPPGSREMVPPGMPMHRWLCAAEPGRAATLLSDGLAEAEPGANRLALTLLRATGDLSRNDLPERPGHAGWPASTPEAQCLGSFRAVCALLLHRVPPDGMLDPAALDEIIAATDDLVLPLVGESWRDLDVTNQHIPGVGLTGSGLELSAVTLSAADPDAVLLRAVNLTDAPVHGMWTMPDEGPWIVTRCRLDETPLDATRRFVDAIPISASARAVVTLRVRRACPESVADERRGEDRQE